MAFNELVWSRWGIESIVKVEDWKNALLIKFKPRASSIDGTFANGKGLNSDNETFMLVMSGRERSRTGKEAAHSVSGISDKVGKPLPSRRTSTTRSPEEQDSF